MKSSLPLLLVVVALAFLSLPLGATPPSSERSEVGTAAETPTPPDAAVEPAAPLFPEEPAPLWLACDLATCTARCQRFSPDCTGYCNPNGSCVCI